MAVTLSTPIANRVRASAGRCPCRGRRRGQQHQVVAGLERRPAWRTAAPRGRTQQHSHWGRAHAALHTLPTYVTAATNCREQVSARAACSGPALPSAVRPASFNVGRGTPPPPSLHCCQREPPDRQTRTAVTRRTTRRQNSTTMSYFQLHCKHFTREYLGAAIHVRRAALIKGRTTSVRVLDKLHVHDEFMSSIKCSYNVH